MSSPIFKLRPKREGEPENDAVAVFGVFREKVSHFSLDFWLIRSSEFFGARRKVALRNEAYAWAPILRSFEKLREVEVLFYLVYFRFKCFVDDLVGLKP